MTRKILIQDREKNPLEIQEGDNELAYSYIQDIIHLGKDQTEYGAERQIVDIFRGHHSAGYLTNVKEIREVW